MVTSGLGEVSPACRRRLLDHYGSAVVPWLRAVPEILAQGADRLGLRIEGYHDAGCASTLATAWSGDGRAVLLKAWYDRSRYLHEVAGLRAWQGPHVPQVLRTVDDLMLASVELVAGRAGGAARPPREEECVAKALSRLHSVTGDVSAFPGLGEYIFSVVLPRIAARMPAFGWNISGRHLEVFNELNASARQPVLLHTDLYQENVLFDATGRPVFVDPLPMIGDPIYDWAFWVVYYDLTSDPLSRLNIARCAGAIPPAELLPWCLLLCVDGLLFYRENGDPRASRMADVITVLLTGSGDGAQW
jgi:streptomycin 6-kinase